MQIRNVNMWDSFQIWPNHVVTFVLKANEKFLSNTVSFEDYFWKYLWRGLSLRLCIDELPSSLGHFSINILTKGLISPIQLKLFNTQLLRRSTSWFSNNRLLMDCHLLMVTIKAFFAFLSFTMSFLFFGISFSKREMPKVFSITRREHTIINTNKKN